MDTSRTTRHPGAAMYLRLGSADVDSAGQVSPVRRAGMLLLALLVVASMPMFWAASAIGDESDVPAAALNKSGPGSGEDADDDDDDDEDTTDGNGRSDGAGDTRGTDGAGDTRGTKLTDQGPGTKAASATDGVNDTSGTDGAGDTRGTKLTDQGPQTRQG